MKPYRPAGKQVAVSADITSTIVDLRDERKLSWAQIASHLNLSRAAVWQRYQRWEKQQ